MEATSAAESSGMEACESKEFRRGRKVFRESASAAFASERLWVSDLLKESLSAALERLLPGEGVCTSKCVGTTSEDGSFTDEMRDDVERRVIIEEVRDSLPSGV